MKLTKTAVFFVTLSATALILKKFEDRSGFVMLTRDETGAFLGTGLVASVLLGASILKSPPPSPRMLIVLLVSLLSFTWISMMVKRGGDPVSIETAVALTVSAIGVGYPLGAIGRMFAGYSWLSRILAVYGLFSVVMSAAFAYLAFTEIEIRGVNALLATIFLGTAVQAIIRFRKAVLPP